VDDWLDTGPRQALCRVATCLIGEVELEAQCDPRPEYGGGAPPSWEQRLSWLTALLPSGDRLVLDGLAAPVDRFTLRAGEHRALTLGWNRPGPSDALASRDETIAHWQAWAENLVLPSVGADHVLRSALVLKGLQYEPTGAFVAAATTSLPEELGGVRNWDYRYSWLRDSAFAVHALRQVGKAREATAWLDYLAEIAFDTGELDLQVLYGIGGERDIDEQELPGLSGYRGSAPVRIGNGAANQSQLDAYGELCDAIWLHRVSTGSRLPSAHWSLVRRLADRAAGEWRSPDCGIWEVRGEARHFVHSKVWCWVALDRALRIARVDGRADAALEHWRSERDAVRADVLAKGWDSELGTFTQSYGSRTLDASNLLLAQVGFIGARDPRFVSTVRAIARGLDRGGFVDRYRVDETDDGLAGGEGTFTICSLWLVLALSQIGAHAEARQRFDRVLACANDVGLLSEQLAPDGEQLGNFPQAFTHLAIVVCAFALERAQQRLLPHELALAA
jgi:GH15 family glucan-1,4-alpha-glucosidase